MLREEWLALVKENDITPDSWEVVNLVYTWHPAMPRCSTDARKMCLTLYKTLGYGIFHDMAPVSRDACSLETKHKETFALHDEAREHYNRLIRTLEEQRNKKFAEIVKVRLEYETRIVELKARYGNA